MIHTITTKDTNTLFQIPETTDGPAHGRRYRPAYGTLYGDVRVVRRRGQRIENIYRISYYGMAPGSGQYGAGVRRCYGKLTETSSRTATSIVQTARTRIEFSCDDAEELRGVGALRVFEVDGDVIVFLGQDGDDEVIIVLRGDGRRRRLYKSRYRYCELVEHWEMK